MSVREDLVTAALAALATITTANGYHSNAGNNVKELSDIPCTTFPAIRLTDGPAVVTTEDVPFGFHQHELTIGIEGYTNTMASARELVEDITAVFWANKTWSGAARWTALVRHDIKQIHADKKFCLAEMEFIITYRTALGAI